MTNMSRTYTHTKYNENMSENKCSAPKDSLGALKYMLFGFQCLAWIVSACRAR